MIEQLYYYAWGNNADAVGRWRLQYKGRECRVIFRGKMNSCLIEFVDNKEKVCCSRNALRKVR